MLKKKPAAQARSKGRQKLDKRATVETDASSEKSAQTSVYSSDSWLDDSEPSDSASVAPVKPRASATDTQRQRPRRIVISPRVMPSNSLGGHPLIPFSQPPYPAPVPIPPPSQHRSGTYDSSTGNAPKEYPSHSVQYPSAPNMQGNPEPQNPPVPSVQSGLGPQTGASPYRYGDPNYHHVYYNPYVNYYPPGMMPGNPNLTFPSPTPPQPPREEPLPPREDPEKIRLEAEIAAFKAMEEKVRAAEDQKEREKEIRKETEEAFHRRMEDLRLAQEEAKTEIERARRDAQKLARESLEAERQAEEMTVKKHAEMMASAEQAAVERLQKERESEQERSRQVANLEKEVRLKVETEKRAKLAEQEAKARQSEDLERLAKLKMLQSMDEIVSLTKKKVLHDLVVDGDTTLTRGKQDWLVKMHDELETGKIRSRHGSSTNGHRTSMTKPRHATASTVHSASTSAKLSSVLAAPPEVPNVPESSDSESAHSRVGANTLPGRAFPQLRRFGRQRRESHDEDLIGHIADAVIERLMSSPYYDVSIRHRQQADRYYTTDSFTPASNPFQRNSRLGNQESFGYGPPPCGPMRQFDVPPKPDHLRGRSLKCPSRSPTVSPPTQQDAPVSRGGSRLSTIHSAPSPPPLEQWLDSTREATSYSEVDTITQETPAIREGYVGAEGVVSGHPTAWFQEALHRMEKVNAGVYVTDQGVEHGFR